MHRLVSSVLLGVMLLVAMGVQAQATEPPTQPTTSPVQLVVPAGRGTLVDRVARELSMEMQRLTGVSYVVQNFADHNGIAGTQHAAQAPADGKTLLLSWSGSLVVNPSLYDNVRFHPEDSFDAIGLVAEIPIVLVVNNDLPVTSLESFTTYVHEHPGRINFASTGSGRITHLAGQLYMMVTDTNMVHVGYSAPEQAISNLINGQIQSMFQLAPRVLKAIRENRVRPLGVMSRQRVPALPQVPTMAEQGYPGLVATVWFALSAPTGTPPEIIGTLNRVLNEAIASASMQATFTDMGALPMGGSPESMDMVLERELSKWEKVVRMADIPFH